jgi:DNA-binding XRE family transcriptional regulator
VAELAERVGVSEVTMLKVEHGDPGVRLGIAFEAAALVGVPLFDEGPSRRALEAARVEETAELSQLTYLLDSGSYRVGALDFQVSATEYVPRSIGSGRGLCPPPLPHHRTCGSASGGSRRIPETAVGVDEPS